MTKLLLSVISIVSFSINCEPTQEGKNINFRFTESERILLKSLYRTYKSWSCFGEMDRASRWFSLIDVIKIPLQDTVKEKDKDTQHKAIFYLARSIFEKCDKRKVKKDESPTVNFVYCLEDEIRFYKENPAAAQHEIENQNNKYTKT